jgi:hypothetical protein
MGRNMDGLIFRRRAGTWLRGQRGNYKCRGKQGLDVSGFSQTVPPAGGSRSVGRDSGNEEDRRREADGVDRVAEFLN